MEFSLTSNLITGTPSWDELIEAFFIERIGRDCRQVIPKRISSSKNRNYFLRGELTDKEAVTRALVNLTDTLVIPPQDEAQSKWLTEFFSAARFFFNRPFCEDFFPQELLPVLKQAFSYAMDQDRILLSDLLEIIESLATRKNRAVYYPMLQELYNNEALPDNLRLRAHKITVAIFN